MKRIVVIVLTGLMVGVLLFAGCGVSKSEVERLDTQIAQLETEITDLKDQLADISELSELLDPAYIAQLQTEKAHLEADITYLKDLLDRFAKLWDPTYAEAVAFIQEDSTNEEVLMDHQGATTQVCLNAAKRGIKCYWVVAQTSVGGFHFVGFHTGDKGWIYFCNSGACGDQEVKLEVGKKLYQLNQWGTAGFDDTIKSIDYLLTFDGFRLIE